MSSFVRKLEKKNEIKEDKAEIKKKTGIVPKHRCPVCHRYTVWKTVEVAGKVTRQCYWCGE